MNSVFRNEHTNRVRADDLLQKVPGGESQTIAAEFWEAPAGGVPCTVNAELLSAGGVLYAPTVTGATLVELTQLVAVGTLSDPAVTGQAEASPARFSAAGTLLDPLVNVGVPMAPKGFWWDAALRRHRGKEQKCEVAAVVLSAAGELYEPTLEIRLSRDRFEKDLMELMMLEEIAT